MSEDMAGTLICGALVDDLLEQVADSPNTPRTAHQQGCVHCQAALAEFETLWAPLHEAAAEDVHAPPALTERVLSRVRAAVESPEWAVLVQAGGLTRISIDVVVRVVRDTAAAVPGVRAVLPSASVAGGTSSRSDTSGVQVGISGSTVAVAVVVAADYGPDLLELGREISRQTRRAVSAVVGVTVAAVSVHIDDVLTG